MNKVAVMVLAICFLGLGCTQKSPPAKKPVTKGKQTTELKASQQVIEDCSGAAVMVAKSLDLCDGEVCKEPEKELKAEFQKTGSGPYSTYVQYFVMTGGMSGYFIDFVQDEQGEGCMLSTITHDFDI